MDNLMNEKQAFDKQILERVHHGHVPDLRHKERNEWFYNNVWRDPEYVQMSFGENLRFFLQYLEPESKILEVGCGPGHLSLELARNRHSVTGVDLSSECIQIAEKTATDNIHTTNFGSLYYVCGDFLKIDLPENSYDAVLFYGSLSHFPNINTTLDHVCKLLTPNGRILIWDTSVDHYTEGDAAIFYLICALLSVTGHYYKEQVIAKDEQQITEAIARTLKELQYLDDKGDKVQSPSDNSQTYQTMMEALKPRFRQLAFSWESSFYRNLIGGIRFPQREKSTQWRPLSNR